MESDWKETLSKPVHVEEIKRWAESIGKDPKEFQLLYNCCTDPGTIGFNAAWVIQHIGDRYPELILPHIFDFQHKIGSFPRRLPDRAILRTISKLERIPSDCGVLIDRCFSILHDPSEETGIQYHSMNVLEKACCHEPALIPEFVQTLEKLMAYATKGTRNRASKLLTKYG